MAIDARSAARTLELLESIRAQPHAHGFYSFVRQIDAINQDKPPLGLARRPEDEPLRFGQEPDTAFAPSEFAGADKGVGKRPPRIFGRFFGLFGPNGALPLHLTEFARNRIRHHRDPTFARFVDIFHHRLTALFYRAWAVSEPCVQRDRPKDDSYAQKINALVGLDFDALHDRAEFEDESVRYFAGHFARQSRDPGSLEALVADYIEAPVRLTEFSGGWVDIPDDERLKMSPFRDCALGVTTVLGQRIFTRQARFTLHIGPLNRDQFMRLFPRGEGGRKLAGLVRLYCGLDLDCEVHLLLKGSDIPPPKLDGSLQLGRTVWMGGGKPGRDGDELHYVLNKLN